MRFQVGERVRVLGHPAKPEGEITARWTGAEACDTHDEPIYAVTGFVTRQRESSLARPGFIALPLDPPGEWRMAGHGRFRRVGPGTIQSEGGPGILWYPRQAFTDFVLLIDWRLSSAGDNSGVFVRIPALGNGDPDHDWEPAVVAGYEIQIDDRGIDPQTGMAGSPRHRTGAIYRRAPARATASRPPGEWNTFEIEAAGPRLHVCLSGVLISSLIADGEARGGYIGLQAHDPGSRVRFRNLQIRPR